MVWVFGVMSLGYVSGLRKAIFFLFTYHVAGKLLMGEYEKTFSDEISKGVDYSTVGLGLFMAVIGAIEVLGVAPAGFQVRRIE